MRLTVPPTATLKDSTADQTRPALKFIGDDVVPPFIGTQEEIAVYSELWKRYPFECVQALRQVLGTRPENEAKDDTDDSDAWTTP